VALAEGLRVGKGKGYDRMLAANAMPSQNRAFVVILDSRVPSEERLLCALKMMGFPIQKHTSTPARIGGDVMTSLASSDGAINSLLAAVV